MSSLIIRRATLLDALIVAEYNSGLARETENIELEPDRVQAGVAAVLRDPNKGVYWVAETPGAGVVGQLLITWEWSDWRNGVFWWIQSVYVHRDFRGRGVFSALYQFVVQQARLDPQVCGVRLYVEGANDRAKRTYQRLGLKETHYQVYETDFRLSR